MSDFDSHGSRETVLLALWDARGREVAMAELLRLTPRAQEIVGQLSKRAQIERTPSGVRLVSTSLAGWSDLLESLARRHHWRIGRRVLVFPRTASTNDIAWQCAEAADGDGTVVQADEQTAGRGRFGHAWHSKAGQSALLSVVLHNVPAATLDRLTLLAGLSAVEAIEAAVREMHPGAAPLHINIKWPNDLLIGERKLAGILVERRAGHGGREGHVVMGVGINVAQGHGDFAPEITGRAISVFGACGLMVDRLRIVAALLERLHQRLVDAPNDAWIDAWKARCHMLGTRIRVRTNGRELSGQILDVDPLKGLMLREDSGGTHFLSAQTTMLGG